MEGEGEGGVRGRCRRSLELVLNPDGTVTAKDNPELVLSNQDGMMVLVKVWLLYHLLSRSPFRSHGPT